MVLKVQRSTWNAVDNLGFENLSDYAVSGSDVTATLVTLLATGAPIYIPPGSWEVTTLTFPSGSVVFGLGSKSVIRIKNAANSVNLSVGSNSTLSNFVVDGNKVNQVGASLHTIQISGSSRIKLDRIHVINSKGDSFNVTGAANEIIFTGCSCTGFLGNGIRVEQGSDITLLNHNSYASDAVSTGDGIAISSNGNAISKVILSDCISKSNVGRGFSFLGNGSKNVSEVSATNCRAESNVSNGIHLINTTGVVILGGLSIANGIDGVRLEGDVVFSRITNVQAKSNTSFGMREVIAGPTPNNNTFAYDISQLNGNNTITVVGGASVVVG